MIVYILWSLLFILRGSENARAADWSGPVLNLPKFVDDLPIPPTVKLFEKSAGSVYEMVATQFSYCFHRDLPAGQVWGYNGNFPGPTLEAVSNQEARVSWVNRLPEHPLITVSGFMPNVQNLPPVRTVVHLHGGSFPEIGFSDKANNADGWPDAWNVPGGSQLAIYPNTQEAAGLWYHDHSMGITSQNVYFGLAGVYLLRDTFERSLNLPKDNYEIPLVIQGRTVNADGSLYYPSKVVSEFYGTMTTVNGKIWPYLTVEPRKYRFRFLNASNARTYAMRLEGDNSVPGPAFYQIGSDGGFLESTTVLNDPKDPQAIRLTLAPGERADVIIDFTGFEGKSLILNNNSQTDDENLEPAVPDVMQFKVKTQVTALDTSVIPTHLRPIVHFKETDARRSRTIALQEIDHPDGSQMLLLNGLRWEDPIVEKPLLNSVEVWNIVNSTEDIHPFHIHLVQFQVMNRQSFDRANFKSKGQVILSGNPRDPDPNETSWKDTVRVVPGEQTKLIMRFGPYAGHYVYHCHILEHEDMDMMRPFEVVTNESLTDRPFEISGLQTLSGNLFRFFSELFYSFHASSTQMFAQGNSFLEKL